MQWTIPCTVFSIFVGENNKGTFFSTTLPFDRRWIISDQVSDANMNTKHYLKFDYIAIGCMVLIFKVMGLVPYVAQKSSVSRQSSKSHQKYSQIITLSPSCYGCCYNLCLTSAQFGLLFIAIPTAINSVDYPGKSYLTTVIETSVAVAGNVVMFTIWLTLGLRQKTGARLLNELLCEDNTAGFIYGTGHQQSNQCYFFLMFLVNVLICSGLVLTEIIGYKPLVITLFAIVVPSAIITWFLIEYSFIVKLIEIKFKDINQQLNECSTSFTANSVLTLIFAGEISRNTSLPLKIVTIRHAHARLADIASKISDFYSFPILLTVGYFSYVFVYSAYYVVQSFVFNSEMQTYAMQINTVLWIASLILPMAMLASSVSNVNKEVKTTADIIRKILISSTINRGDKIELQCFMLELMHRKIRFTACGLFSLDFSLVHSIISMSATYLVILIQLNTAVTE